MTCPSCLATNPPGATWCGQCHTRFDEPAVPQGPAPTAPAHVMTYSRWRKTHSTFGPFGRVTWTVGVALVVAMALFSQNPFAIGPLCFVFAPLVLRGVWAKGRVS